MLTITNKKIGSLETQWAPFKSFSVLFDNPDSCLSPMNGGRKKHI